MADKRISQLIERTDIANNDVLPIVASGATTTNKVTISTIQTWMQDNLDVGVTSVGLSMPSAFVVSNSPVTASGNITVTGAGTVAQYIRGDGSLADFPQSAGGGGASVSYYLNGSVSQGTIGGIAYLEMNKTPILAAGTDFTIAADGYIASFITDAGDPGLLEIPGGNWNFETYLSASSGGGSPTFYIELYKVNSGGTATLIASNSGTPESISLGTNINPYFSALAVPQTTLALTDRLALRYYVTHAGRTITLHTENSHLCQIITTFTTGLTALNGLTAQVQNFATGTSGTDFNISSAGSTHTFNIPSASAIARGLVTTGTQTIAGSKTFSDTLYTTPDAIINGLNVGKGGGNLTTNTRFGTAALGANTTGSSNTAIGFGSSQSNTTGTSNTAVGLYSLLYNTIGASNTAIGSGSMLSNTIGNQNTAIGDSSLYSNTSGSQNTAIGRGSLNTNSTGNDNLGIGFFALYSNTTGSANTSVGSRSLYTNTTGTGNTATGYFSLRFNTTGGSNTATGYVALSANTTGNANTATGAYALENNTTGSDNTAVGQEALENNTTGGNNTAIGFQALRSNTGNGANTAVGNLSLWNNTAGLNTALGHISLYSNTTGEYNVGLGIASLYNNTTGSYNIAIGDQSGQFISGGGNNIISNNSLFIGTQTRALGNNQTNQIVIGHYAIGNGSNTVTLGNDSITTTFLKGNISLKGENSAVKSIQYTNPSGTLHWSVQTSFGSAGEHQPFSIRNGVLGTDAILIQPASNNITLNNSITNLLGSLIGTSASFTGAVSSSSKYTWGSSTTGTTGQIATDGTNNYLDYIGNLVFRGAAASNTLATISSTGAVTLTGSLSGTSASFTGAVNSDGRFAAVTNQTAPSDGSAYFYKSSAGAVVSGFQFLAETGGAGSRTTKLTIDSTGAATFSSSVTAGGQVSINSGFGTSTPAISIYNNTGASASNVALIDFRVNNTFGGNERVASISASNPNAAGNNGGQLNFLVSANGTGTTPVTALSLASTGAATFSSSVNVGGTSSNTDFRIYRTVDAGAYLSISAPGGSPLTSIIGISGTNVMSLNQSGNVGIGTPTPLRTLSLLSDSYIGFGSGNGTRPDFQIGHNSSQGVLSIRAGFGSDDTDVCVNTSGNVGIGTPTPGARLEVKQGGSEIPMIIDSSSDSFGAYTQYQVNNSGGWEVGMARAADNYSYLFSYGSFGTANAKVTISNSGGFFIGGTSPVYSEKALIQYAGTGNQGFHINQTGSSGANDKILFSNSNGIVGFIRTDGSSTSYSTSSDYRLKENVKPVEGALSKISELKPCTFNFKSNPDEDVIGFLAHEVQEVMPQAVSGEKDAVQIRQVEVSPAEVDEEGNVITEAVIEEKEVPVYQGIDHSKLVPLLVAAIQEQQDQIKSLTEQVEALKSQING